MIGLPSTVVEEAVTAALAEDLGRSGDVTTDATVPADAVASARLVARQAGVVAGLGIVERVFERVDPGIQLEIKAADGDPVEPGSVLAEVRGPARGILIAERTALNFLGHLSGIATATSRLVELVAPYGTKVVDTRKTTPGLRALEKYAVRAGGGANHRFGLDDGVLIKDNHLAVAGSIARAVAAARTSVGHLRKVEVEVENLEQVEEAVAAGADIILLDNMDNEQLREAVKLIDGRAVAEASGGIGLDNAAEIAATGVDLIAVGSITHSAPQLDVALDFD